MKTNAYKCNKCTQWIYPDEINDWDGCCHGCGSSDLDYQGLVDDDDSVSPECKIRYHIETV